MKAGSAGKDKGKGSLSGPGRGKAPPSGKVAGKGAGKGGGPPMQGYLTSMWIEWCDGKGGVYTRWVDVTKISGLIWQTGASGPGPNPPSQPKLPGSKAHKIANVTCGPPPPAGGECCYWDGMQWICPNDFNG